MSRRLDRLARLVALAADQLGTPEGDLARQRAEALAAELGVEVDGDPMVFEPIDTPASEWARLLRAAAALLAGGHFLHTRGRRRSVFVGRRSALALFQHLVEYFDERHRTLRSRHMDDHRQVAEEQRRQARWPEGAAWRNLRREVLRKVGREYSLAFAKTIYSRAYVMHDAGWRASEREEAHQAAQARYEIKPCNVSRGGSAEGYRDGQSVQISRPLQAGDVLALEGVRNGAGPSTRLVDR